MRITESQLRTIVRQEYLRTLPPGGRLIAHHRGRAMTEARARRIAAEMMNEGLFDMLKAAAKGLFAGGSAAGEKVGEKASAAMQPAIAAVTATVEKAKAAASDLAAGVGQIKDAAVKAAVEKYQADLKASLQATIKTQLSNGLKELVSAGMPEADAKNFIASITAATAAGVSG